MDIKETMEILKEKLKVVKEIDRKTVYNYKYKYWNVTENGMELDVKAANTYGEDRDSYEKYKTDIREGRTGVIIDDSGKVSLRAVIDTNTKETIGYVTEEKLSNKPYVDNVKEIYETALEDVKEFLGVQDIDSFLYYINHNIASFDFYGTSETLSYERSLEGLIELIEEYDYDEEYKKYIDKVIS